ncbi:hypothetical protein BD289DRAFT_479117 [Coniella lustricola]|uniref:RNase MRP protein 1 RNA binding domain-containing protein n=1 Tax=Coniella lustricola TaxID=2025994 RepID=A0A2T3AJZ5_9PEZI|nr:hypothetical protein BD289DRAFT_479117 [Coniella lustricola]
MAHSPPPLPTLQSTLTSLSTASDILSGFAHRNKNQHRATKWWPAFDMLRRHLHKALPDLEAAVQRAQILLANSTCSSTTGSGFPPPPHKKQRRKTTSVAGGSGSGSGSGSGVSTSKEHRQPELDRSIERLAWVHHVLTFKCYQSFTQLTADRQFAQLGLVLLGVLAQVQAAISPLIPSTHPLALAPNSAASEHQHQTKLHTRTPDNQQNTSDLLDVGEAVSRDSLLPKHSPSPHPPQRQTSSADQDHNHDLGVAISRDELASLRRNQHPIPAEEEGEGEEDPSLSTPLSPSSSRPTKRKKTKPDTTATTNMGLSEDRPPLPTTHQKQTSSSKMLKKKKKKSKRGGDEFDDLFDGLM